MTDISERLAAPFTNGEVLQFSGRGGISMDYIEDETVMDRLDAVLGLGNWTYSVDVVDPASAIVRGRLSVRLGDDWTTFEDFGYPNREGGEGLKEAVSDNIRRLGRFVGVGRYLYHKHSRSYSNSPAPAGAPPARSDRPRSSSPAVAAPPPATAGTGADDEDWAGLLEQAAASGAAESVHEAPGRPQTAEAVCSVHGAEKRRQRRSDGSYYCAGKRPDGAWCDWRQAA